MVPGRVRISMNRLMKVRGSGQSNESHEKHKQDGPNGL
jgi:hypothetical protein